VFLDHRAQGLCGGNLPRNCGGPFWGKNFRGGSPNLPSFRKRNEGKGREEKERPEEKGIKRRGGGGEKRG